MPGIGGHLIQFRNDAIYTERLIAELARDDDLASFGTTNVDS